VRTSNYDKIVAGAIAVSGLAIALNWLLRALEKRATLRTRGEA
jgi:ABC-type proline/glycine betaine transport system permease subunit